MKCILYPTILLLSLIGCAPPAQPTTGDAGRAATDDFHKNMQGELDRMSDQLKALKERAAAAGAETRQKLQPEIDRLEKETAAARSRLAQLGQQGAEAWKAAQPELEKAMHNLGDALKKASDQFRK